MHQINTLSKLVRFAARESLRYHSQADVMKSFRRMNPGFDTGFAPPSPKCLLRWAHRQHWPMGPKLKKLAAEAAANWK